MGIFFNCILLLLQHLAADANKERPGAQFSMPGRHEAACSLDFSRGRRSPAGHGDLRRGDRGRKIRTEPKLLELQANARRIVPFEGEMQDTRESYKYADVPLTSAIAEELIVERFAGELVLRQTIVEETNRLHISLGGAPRKPLMSQG